MKAKEAFFYALGAVIVSIPLLMITRGTPPTFKHFRDTNIKTFVVVFLAEKLFGGKTKKKGE